LTPETTRRIESASQTVFGGKVVIGLHYRGTDKVKGPSIQAARVDYAFISRLLRELVRLPFDFSLFVATDEAGFISFLQNNYPGELHFTQSERSEGETPVHLGAGSSSPSQLGMEALVDSVLLSRCDFLLRCESNLSHVSSFFNPDLKSLNLSPLMRDPADGKWNSIVDQTLKSIGAIYARKQRAAG
jgi:hypothetical protein